jgi:hypothetical protein
MSLSLARIKYLREELERTDEPGIDLEELSEIEEAFKDFPDDQLRDLRENAMASDMLDELETLVSPLEIALFEYIEENYGESEALDPCYDMGSMVGFIESKFEVKEK